MTIPSSSPKDEDRRLKAANTLAPIPGGKSLDFLLVFVRNILDGLFPFSLLLHGTF